jgi:hypothetical protein
MFDREAVFIDRVMVPLRRQFPELKVVFEHITTKQAAQYVAEAGAHTAATITAHHLLYNRNAIFLGGLRPHYYCLPVLKREVHRLALLQAATSGSAKFFLGTDSAPHAAALKEASVCGAGRVELERHDASRLGARYLGRRRAVGEVQRHQRREVAPWAVRRPRGQDALAIGERHFGRRDRWPQVRHHDRARELRCRGGQHRGQRGTVAQVQVPVVGAGERERVGGGVHLAGIVSRASVSASGSSACCSRHIWA